jgi:hypothetical protein
MSARIVCDGPAVKVPAYFYMDHMERELPTPNALGSGKTYFWIALNDPATPELLDDARYYCDPYGPGAGDRNYSGLRTSARFTVKAIEKAMRRAGAISNSTT